ncbi:MAG: SH3 domain-containing protein [Lachnospiraceae bacterium]|nr:SH3 domain-containing protein [Lachnospiraceae bacterium]
MRSDTCVGGMRLKGGCRLRKVMLPVLTVTLVMTGAQSTFAYTAVKGTITCTSGKVRKEASTSSSFAFGVKQDDEVTVIDEKKGDDGKIWYKIKIGDSTGFIRSDLIAKSKTQVKTGETGVKEEAAKAAFGTVLVDMAILRHDPTTKADLEICIKQNEDVEIKGSVKGDDDKDWYSVIYKRNGISYKGYVRADLLKTSGKVQALKEEPKEAPKEGNDNAGPGGDTSPGVQVGTVKGVGVNVRETAVDGKVVGTVSTGRAVTVTEQVTGSDGNVWYKISFTSNLTPQTGFIRSDYVEGVTSNVTAMVTEEGNSSSLSENKAPEEAEEEKQEEVKEEPLPYQGSDAATGTVRGTAVRIRQEAVGGTVIEQLSTGHRLNILGEVTGSDNNKWYCVEFTAKGTERKGYIRSDFVTVITTDKDKQPCSDQEFENSIACLPNDYKANLRALHEKYPGWRFEAFDTGLDWNEAVAAECSVGKNLVPLKSISSWKSTEPQAYNWSGNWWYGFDGGTWASASREIISYYMDPRNFLDESGIFQFEQLDSFEYQNEEGVRKIVEGTYLDSSFVDTDGVERNYIATICEAAREIGISPYHLATRMIQEQGLYGRSQSISGTMSGHEGYFNYFNIGAYQAGGRLPVENGLIYAAGNDEEYFRPWNSRYRSIYGSAKYVANKYIKKGQNTLYFEKFNVSNRENGIYSHQYMSNIQAASSESARMKKAYTDTNSVLVFRIPYYYNMPDAPCEKPIGESDPNNYLSGLWVEGLNLTPDFSSTIDTYYLTVDNSVSQINVGATPVAGTSSIGGVGAHELNVGTNTIPVVCKAQNGNKRTYTLCVQRN